MHKAVLPLLCSLLLSIAQGEDPRSVRHGRRPTPTAQFDYDMIEKYMIDRGYSTDSQEAFNYARSVTKGPAPVVQILIWVKSIGE